VLYCRIPGERSFREDLWLNEKSDEEESDEEFHLNGVKDKGLEGTSTQPLGLVGVGWPHEVVVGVLGAVSSFEVLPPFHLEDVDGFFCGELHQRV
jgi:hypothetical protein